MIQNVDRQLLIQLSQLAITKFLKQQPRCQPDGNSNHERPHVDGSLAINDLIHNQSSSHSLPNCANLSEYAFFKADENIGYETIGSLYFGVQRNVLRPRRSSGVGFRSHSLPGLREDFQW